MKEYNFEQLEASLRQRLEEEEQQRILRLPTSERHRRKKALEEQLLEQNWWLNQLKLHKKELSHYPEWETIKSQAQLWLKSPRLWEGPQREEYERYLDRLKTLLQEYRRVLDRSLNERIVHQGMQNTRFYSKIKNYKHWIAP